MGSSNGQARLASLFRREFELCKVRQGELAAILSDTGSNAEYVDVSATALEEIGARVFHVSVISRPTKALKTCQGEVTGVETMEGMAPVVEALKSSQFIVDLTTTNQGGLIHDPARARILAGGARILHVGEPAEVLERCISSDGLRERCERAAEMLRRTRRMHVTSPAGTDLHVIMEGSRVNPLTGYADTPGKLDTFMGGFVAAFPAKRSVQGKLVLDVGDINLTFLKYIESQVRFTFKDDLIVQLEGDGLDSRLMQDYFSRWNDPNAWGISHVGFGLNENARWNALTMYERKNLEGSEARAFSGNFLPSTGPNPVAGRGTLCHFDLPMRNCTVALDGVEVIRQGEVISPELRP
jgi:2,5-dihydroxypyridine 5,6-dioxygenase